RDAGPHASRRRQELAAIEPRQREIGHDEVDWLSSQESKALVAGGRRCDPGVWKMILDARCDGAANVAIGVHDQDGASGRVQSSVVHGKAEPTPWMLGTTKALRRRQRPWPEARRRRPSPAPTLALMNRP